MASIAEPTPRASAEAAERLFVEWVIEAFRRDCAPEEGAEGVEGHEAA